MKNNEFQELVDRNLSELVWDEQKRRRTLIAIREEGKPMKKLSTTLLLAAVIVCLTVSALAAGIGIVFSKKVDDEKLAEEALLSKYGITSEMLSFFSRSDEKSDKDSGVRYDGIYPFTYVLGNYTVLIRDGKAEASWSRDGMDTSGGFDADAWGADQLSEMLQGGRETHDVSEYARQALLIAVKNGAAVPAEPSEYWEDEDAQMLKEMFDAEIAKSAARLSVPEMEALARDALAARYSFDAHQSGCLNCEDENCRYLLYGESGLPCYELYFSLGFEEDGYDGPGAGIYTVTVNVEDGTIEDIMYDSVLAGNG